MCLIFSLFLFSTQNQVFLFAIDCQKQREPYQCMSQPNLSGQRPNRQGLTRYAYHLFHKIPIEITAHKKNDLVVRVFQELVRKCHNQIPPHFREMLSI